MQNNYRSVPIDQSVPFEDPTGNYFMPIPSAAQFGPSLPPNMLLPKEWLFPRAAITPYQGNHKGSRRDRFNHHYSQNSKYLSNINGFRG